MRVISMIASSTEIVCALGCENLLVGRSHECDYPESIKSLPITTEIKFSPDGTSYQIDEKVKALLQEGLSVYRVKGELLKTLKPDVILTQTQCEVCAVSPKDIEEATFQWLGSQPRVISLHPNALEDLWRDIASVAHALEVEERGNTLISSLKTRIEILKQEAEQLSAALPKKLQIACIEWLDPLMAAGNWVPELVDLAGAHSLFGEAGKHSPWMNWNELRDRNPDILVLMPCGFDIPKTQKELSCLTQHPLWGSLKAVQENQVYIVDGNAYLNRPGPRLVDSLEILIEIFYPDPKRMKFYKLGWCRI